MTFAYIATGSVYVTIGSIFAWGAVSYLASAAQGPSGLTTMNEIETKSPQQATYGANIPRIYGRVKLSGNIFWLRNNRIDIKKTYVENEGGKGGGADPGGNIVQEAFATFAVGLGIGPCFAIGRIWAAKQLIYNIMRDSTARLDEDGVFHGRGQVSGKPFSFELFPGTIDQPPSDVIQADVGMEHTSRYPRLCYVLMKGFPLESFGNTLQVTNFEFELIKLPQSYSPEPPA